MTSLLGPIVRINPYELSVDDIDFYDELYTYSRTVKRDRYDWQTKLFGTPAATFSAGPHELHRVRRAAIAPFFSKKNVRALEPWIVANLERLCKKLQKCKETGEVVPFGTSLTAVTTDIISKYQFGSTWNKLDEPGMGASWHEVFYQLSEFSSLVKQCGWIVDALEAIPESIVQRFFPDSLIGRWQKVCPL